MRMTGRSSDELVRGAYAPAEAGRIAQLAPRRVRRWLAGYDFKPQRGDLRHSGPLFPREHAADEVALTFMDLIEVLYVRAFLRFGVSMHRVKLVHREAREEFGTGHPFAVKRFETDGTSIFMRFMQAGSVRVEDRYKRQMVEHVVFDPLMKRIDYLSDLRDAAAVRYWPLGRETPVVVDPRYAFGEAVVAKSFVPTRVLFEAHRANATTQRITGWYKVDADEVRAAVEYEKSLLPAAA